MAGDDAIKRPGVTQRNDTADGTADDGHRQAPSESSPVRTSGVDPKLLTLLVCPLTKTALHYDREHSELVSRAAGLASPIRNGVPLLIEDAARTLGDDE